MKRFLIFIVLTAFSPVLLKAQSCVEVLQATYGGTQSDVAYDIVDAGNSQFFMVGNTNSFGAGSTDILVIKMDAAKKILWSKTYGVAGNETIRKATASPGGGLLITGQTTSFNNPKGDILCLEIDASGNMLWMRTFGVGSSNGDLGSEIIQTADGGYAITGILDVAGNVADGIVIRLNTSANIIWSKRYHSGIGEDGSGIIEAGTKLVVTSDIELQSGNDYVSNITEFQTSNGNVLLSKNIVSPTKGMFRPLIYKDGSNGYWLSGHLIEGGDYNQMEQVILKLSSSYAISKTYKIVRSPLTNFYYTGFAPLKGGGFITCASEPYTAGGKGHIYKVNSNGTTAFSKQISTTGKNSLNALSVIGDKVFTVGADNSSADDNFYLAEFDTSGNSNNLCNVDTSFISIQNHPFTVSDYKWSSVVDQPFSNTVQNLISSNQAIGNNVICSVDTCKIVKADFTIPDTVCVNTPVNIVNKSIGASSYYWNFCVAGLNDPPTATNLGNIAGAFSSPVFMDYAFDNGNYYGFVTNYSPGGLTRLDFGNSLLNIPTATSLGNFNGALPVADGTEGIQIIKNEDKWYAIVVGGNTTTQSAPRIVKIEFGLSLSNPSPVATNWGNIGNMDQPVDLHVFNEGGNWYGFTVNAENNSITRFNFTSSFNNTPTATNLGNLGNLSYPTGIYAINDNGFWRVFIVNAGNKFQDGLNSSLTRLDFGSSLLNNPTAVNLGNPGNELKHPRDISILKSCGEIVAFVVNGKINSNELIKLDFNNDLTIVPSALNLGNGGSLNFPHSISKIFRVNNDLFAFVTNVANNTITRLSFKGCNNAVIPNSNLKTPPPVTYTTAGTYNINLTIDDGLATQASVCKQVVVLPKPAVDFSYSQDACNPLQFSFSGSDSIKNIKWDFGDGITVAGRQNIEHVFAKNGTYTVSYFYDGFCPSSITKTFTISFANNDIIKNADTVICENGSVQMRTNSALSYCWTPSTYLSNATIAEPIAKPLKDITYTVVSKKTGNNLVVNGDFTNGNTGFTSAYSYANSGLLPAVYFVANSPNPWHPSMPFCKDHTTGSGNMMLVNGAEISGVVVWTQKINVAPNTYYEFSCWLEHITTVNPAKLQFSINGIQVGNVFNANSVSCIWDRFFANWNSGSNTTAEISILNMNNAFAGNDFALDDISFAPVIYVKDSVSLTINKPSVKTNNDTTVCAGTPVQLNTIGGLKYSWSPSVNLNNSAISNPIATVTDTTAFIVTGTNVYGCIAKDTVIIRVLKQISGNIDFSYQPGTCNPLNTQFYSPGNINAYWNFGDGSPVLQQQNPLHVFNTSGIYSVKMWVAASNCQNQDTVTKLLPLLITNENIILNPDTIICENNTVQMRSVPAAEYCWSPSTYLSNTSINNPVAKPLQNITYYLTSKQVGNNLIKNGAFSAGNVDFTSGYNYSGKNTTEGEYFVGPNPQSWNGALSQCVDHSNGLSNMLLVNGSPAADVIVWTQTIAVTPNTNYEFSTWIQALYSVNPAKLQFSINGNVLGENITASLPTCNWNRFNTNWNSGNNISAIISIINKNTEVKGNDFALDDLSFAPVFYKKDSVRITIDMPLVKAGNDTTVCVGSTIQLNAAGAIKYSWSPVSGLSNTNIANPVATIAAPVSYVVSGTNGNGCIATDTVQVIVLPKPVISISNDTSICGSGNAQLTSSGGVKYLWTPAGSLNNANISSPIASPVATTVYHVTVTATNSCIAVDSVKITVAPPFKINISNDTTVCAGSPLQLLVSGGTSYSWLPVNTLSNANIANPVATPFVNTKYKVIVKDATNCIATDSVTVSTLALPALTISADTAICKNGMALLKASGAASYQWYPSGSLSSPSSANTTATPALSTLYKVEATGANNCKSFDSVNVNILPPPIIQISSDAIICGVGSVGLNAAGGIGYFWTPKAGLSNPFSSSPIASPAMSTRYNVLVTGSNSCTDTASVLVKVLPAMVTGITQDTTVCGLVSLPLLATGGTSFQWSPASGLSSPSIANPVANVATSTVYTVKITNADNCFVSRSVTIKFLDLPVVSISNDTTVCRVSPVQLHASGGISYQWTPAAVLDNSVTDRPIATIASSTLFRVTVTDANGCRSTGTMTLAVRPAPVFGIKTMNPIACPGKPVQLEAYGGDRYQWSPLAGLSNAEVANPFATLQYSQTYSVVITETVCKEQATFSVPVTVKELTPVIVTKSNDISCNIPTAQLNATLQGFSYSWTPSSGLSNSGIANPIVSVDKTTTYSVAVIDTNGCKQTGSVKVEVLNNNNFKLYQMPNAFTPGTDGKNDCFGISKWGKTNILFFEIYNRWGQIVFRGNNTSNCWDGTFNGIPQQTSNFVFRLRVETLCGIIDRKGNFVLIR